MNSGHGNAETVDVEKLISSMTPEEKLGQMLIPIFQSSDIPKDIEDFVVKLGVGFMRYCPNANFDNMSVVVDKPNPILTPSQTAEVLNELQKMARKSRMSVPLVVTCDQEGGGRSDLTRGGITIFPVQMAFGAIDDPALTRKAAGVMASELSAMGIGIIQSPIVDVPLAGNKATLRTSSFGGSTELVTRHALALMNGFKDGGVVAMAKHFPSYGASAIDAHVALPCITKTKAELEHDDMPPYRACFKEGLKAVMIGHVIAHCLDAQDHPATINKGIIQGFLRKELGFDGIVQTDAMRMAAVLEEYGIEKATVMAVQAGCDSVLLRGEADFFMQGYNAALHALKNDEFDMREIDMSVRRILRLKNEMGLFQNPFVDVSRVDQIVGTRQHKEISMEVARRSVTVTKNDGNILPLQKNGPLKILAASTCSKKLPASMDPIQSPDMLVRAFKEMHATTEGAIFPLKPHPALIAEIVEKARKNDIVIIGTSNLSQNKEQKLLVQQLVETDKPVIVVAIESPFDYLEIPGIRAALAVYGDNNDSMKAAAEILFGSTKPTGKLPV